MREIKFRGKRIDNGEWVYGFYCKAIPETSETYIAPEWLYNCYEAMGKNEQWSLRFDEYFEVIPQTVGQYTGLKDKNGVEIYDGDVVRCWGGASAFGYHEFEENILIDEFYQLRVNEIGYYDEFYILGNIHENPELLEVTK